MKYTLKRWEYSFDASTKGITLLSPHNEIDISQIVSIRNTTRNELLYSDDDSRYQITMSGDVVTHTYDNTQHADGDNLRIEIDAEFDFTNLDRVLMETDSVAAGEFQTTGWFNIEGYSNITLYISSLIEFTWYVQVADNPADNPDGFDACNKSGTPYTYTTVGKGDPIVSVGKAIPMDTLKGSQMRVVAYNAGASAEAPYCGVK